MHIFDSKPARTRTGDEISQLLDRLVGPLSKEDYGFADLKDKLALYQALPLLMPEAALSHARQAVTDGQMTPDDIAKQACMPLELIEFMLLDEWSEISGTLDAI